jgi:hypothetical protein
MKFLFYFAMTFFKATVYLKKIKVTLFYDSINFVKVLIIRTFTNLESNNYYYTMK